MAAAIACCCLAADDEDELTTVGGFWMVIVFLFNEKISNPTTLPPIELVVTTAGIAPWLLPLLDPLAPDFPAAAAASAELNINDSMLP